MRLAFGMAVSVSGGELGHDPPFGQAESGFELVVLVMICGLAVPAEHGAYGRAGTFRL